MKKPKKNKVVTFKDLCKNYKNKGYLKQIPLIKRSDVKYYYTATHYDGACSGLLYYQDKLHYFHIFNGVLDRIRKIAILETSQSLLNICLHDMKLFQENLGFHTTFDENEKRIIQPPLLQDPKPDNFWKNKLLKEEHFNNAIVLARYNLGYKK